MITIDAPSAPFMIERAIEKVQSLALAKIELNREFARSPRKELEPLAPVAQPSVTLPAESSSAKPEPKEECRDDVLARAREMFGKKKEPEKVTGDAAADEEECPWRDYMNEGEVDEKDVDKALKKMEKTMKMWEERMKNAAKPDVEVTQDHKLLQGGYLETVVCFTEGSSNVLTESQEAILRAVAATVRMREKLKLQLIGCGVELDGPVATMRRLCTVQKFFETDGITCNAVHAVKSFNGNFIRPTWMPANQQPRYVLCRLHMNDDMELCGHLLGTLFSSKRKTRDQAAWLKSNFEIITY